MPEAFRDIFSFKNHADRNTAKYQQQSPSLKKTFKRIVSYLKPQGSKNITENMTTASDVSQTSIQLPSLPAELLLMIISHLDIVNQVCLQMTCRCFRAFIIVDRVALEHDRCRRWAITCILEDAMDKYPAKIACAFCKTVRPTKMFRKFRHELGLCDCLRHPGVFQRRPGKMKSIPLVRFCIQHQKDNFTRDHTLRTSEGIPVIHPSCPTPRWLTYQVCRCWHCGSIIRFDDKQKAGCLNCRCDFCPRIHVEHYFRADPCEQGQGLYKWDGLCDVKIGRGRKKTIRAFCVREVGGGIVPIYTMPEEVTL